MIITTIEMLEYARRAYSHPQHRLIWRIGKVGVPVLPKLGAELGHLRGRGPPFNPRVNRTIIGTLIQKEIITSMGPLVRRDLLPGLSKFGGDSCSILVNRRTCSLSTEGDRPTINCSFFEAEYRSQRLRIVCRKVFDEEANVVCIFTRKRQKSNVRNGRCMGKP